MIVMKFGGTSVGDAGAISRVCEIVGGRRLLSPVVVVSALAGVTDGLLRLETITQNGTREDLRVAIEHLLNRHRSIAHALDLPPAFLISIEADGTALLRDLESRLGTMLNEEARDSLASRGEIWSSRLVAAALARAGLPADWVDVRPVLRTDERFGRATPDLVGLSDRGRLTFGRLLEAGRIPVTQGYIGSTVNDRTTTLGRGGSDFTAALLGTALDAQRVEIWTDVDGIMTADPRIVPEARTLAAVSYEEAGELATFGAKVLHPATQLPLAQAGIPIQILNSFAPDRNGTTIADIDPTSEEADTPIRSISLKKGITLVTVRAVRRPGPNTFLHALFETCERHELGLDVLTCSEAGASLTVDDPARLEKALPELRRLGELRVEPGRAIIAVVGTGLRDTPGIAGRTFAAIADTNVEVISQGASAINVTFVVREEYASNAVRRLHDEFFGTVVCA